MVYLLCFHSKLKHAKHYIGFVERPEDLDRRMSKHKKGNGSKLMAAVTKAGIDFTIARLWPQGDRNFERKLKNRKNSKHLCPVCSAKPSVFKPLLVIDTETRCLDMTHPDPNNSYTVPISSTVVIIEDSYKPTKSLTETTPQVE